MSKSISPDNHKDVGSNTEVGNECLLGSDSRPATVQVFSLTDVLVPVLQLLAQVRLFPQYKWDVQGDKRIEDHSGLK